MKYKAKNIQIVKDGLENIEIYREKPKFDHYFNGLKSIRIKWSESKQKNKGNNKNVKITAQIAHALERDREKVIEAGFNDYISKTIDKEKLLELINKHLKIKKFLKLIKK